MVYTIENVCSELLVLLTSGEYIFKILENLEGTARIGNFNNIKKHTHKYSTYLQKRYDLRNHCGINSS